MIGKKAEAVLNRAVKFAVESEHEYFTLEHVFWSLLLEQTICDLVQACGGDSDRLRLELEESLQNDVPKVPSPRKDPPDSPPQSHPGDDSYLGSSLEHPVATLSVQRLIQRALFFVQSAGKDEIAPEDLFVALFQAKDTKALQCLAAQKIDRLDVLNYLSHGIRKDEQAEGPGGGVNGDLFKDSGKEWERDASRAEGSGRGGPNRGSRSTDEDALALYAVNLNERALAGKLDPLIGRSAELDRMVQVLMRRKKNNPLLVGEAGVGKTALAEGLAQKIVEKSVPEVLYSSVVYSLDLGALLAGAKFRGDFEQRFKRVMAAIEAKRKRGFDPVLFIDEIHTIIGAGSVSGGSMDAAHLLKPILTRGEIKCIGSTTIAEYRSIFEKDHALARRFQKVEVLEPSQEDCIQIVMGLKSRFEEFHHVNYSDEAVRAAVELSSKHIGERFLPDKAIDVIDEAGAKARFKAENRDFEISIGIDQIEAVVAQMARIPSRSVNTNQKHKLKTLKSDLKLAVFGQDPAIDALVTAIRLARSGLRTGDRPIGSFLFCGPTGVGKTELCKQLAHCLGVPFVRFDMSEYSEKHTVSRLIGAPPGYVGFDQPGVLTEAVSKSPYSVILLDEIEKAHSEVWNILLQVMDHGTLTDNNGRRADFRNTILIMTSNVGSRDLDKKPLGIVSGEFKGTDSSRAVEQTFSPEFRNRLDSIVYFNPLDPATLGQVVNKQLIELEAQLLAKGVDSEFSEDVRSWLAEKGYDRLLGARPLARLIQDKVKKPLAEEILFGKLENGGRVKVSILEGQLQFAFEPSEASEKGEDRANQALSEQAAAEEVVGV